MYLLVELKAGLNTCDCLQLDPLIFLIYINDLPSHVSSKVSLSTVLFIEKLLVTLTLTYYIMILILFLSGVTHGPCYPSVVNVKL